MISVLAAAAALGLASIPHCAAMCGPLAVASGAGPRSSWGYHAGRGVSYLVVGALAGLFGAGLTNLLPGRVASALLSWTLAASLGWTAYRLWNRGEPQGTPSRLVSLGRAPTETTSARLFRLLPKHPFTLGLITGALPCGALYAALLVSAGSGSPVTGALAMLSFGATSALGLVFMATLATQMQRRIEAGRDARALSRVLAAGLLVGALVLAIRPIAALQQPEAPPPCHTAVASESSFV